MNWCYFKEEIVNMEDQFFNELQKTENSYAKSNKSFTVIVDFMLHLNHWCTPVAVISFDEKAFSVSVLCFSIVIKI